MKNLRTLTVKEAMERTGFPRGLVYKLVRTGEWQHLKAGDASGTIRILETSIETWFATAVKGQAQVASARARAMDADSELPPVEHPAFS